MFFKGVLIGVAIAAPVGPIGLLCIQRTLNNGRVSGLVSGLGAATADALYGFIAAFGLTLISAFLLRRQAWLAGIGGLYLCYLGVQMMRTSTAEAEADAAMAGETRGLGTLPAYASTLALTLTNPVTILSFLAIYAGLGLAAGAGGYGSASLLVLGVFTGSALWWLALSSVVDRLRHRVDARAMHWINMGAGVIVIGFGLYALTGVVA
jgi:threonine/homoserine/homoserine lactone efflux protein